jgi:hypothetical protein
MRDKGFRMNPAKECKESRYMLITMVSFTSAQGSLLAAPFFISINIFFHSSFMTFV